MKKHLLFLPVLCFLSAGLLAQNYSIYIAANIGGTSGAGTFLRYDYPSGKDTVLINFNGTNGAEPTDHLFMATNGYIYQNTDIGGTFNKGVINRFDPGTNADTVLLNFNGTNGDNTQGGGMKPASNGLFYGIAIFGGTYNKGVFYSFDPTANSQTVLFSFHDTIGTDPGQSPFQGSSGLIYGHTNSGGVNSDGVIYSYNYYTSTYTVLKSFTASEGNYPRGIMQASNGLIYGLMGDGGTNGYGLMYSFDPLSLAFDTLFEFNGSNGIYGPNGELFQASNGLIYSTTRMGGTSNNGVLFAYDINTATDSLLLNFSGTNGSGPVQNNFIQTPDGLIWYTVDSGGTHNLGVLACYSPVTGKDSVVINFNDTNGALPEGLLFINHPTDGIKGISANNPVTINVFPNPSNGVFTVSMKNKEPRVLGVKNIAVFNVLGEQVYSQFTIHSSPFTIDLSSNPGGIYFLKVTTDNGETLTQKVSVIR